MSIRQQYATDRPARPQTGPVGVLASRFVEQWNAPLLLGSNNEIKHLYLRGDVLYAYSGNDKVYAMSASGGQLLWGHQMGQPGDQIQPPLVLDKGLTVIAGISTIDRVDIHGNSMPVIEIGHSIRQPLAAAKTSSICGLTSNRRAIWPRSISPSHSTTSAWKFQITAGISASPALFQGIVFAGGEDGRLRRQSSKRDVPLGCFPIGAVSLQDRWADCRRSQGG